jgi:lipoprotein signal peptidase
VARLSIWIYLVLFVAVITADQLSKQWAIRALPTAGHDVAEPRFGWTQTPSPPLERLGGRLAAFVWLIAGAGGAALCVTAPEGAAAGLGGIAAWAAAASNLGEWWRRGCVVDWMRLWPRSHTNLADLVLIAGTTQLLVIAVTA